MRAIAFWGRGPSRAHGGVGRLCRYDGVPTGASDATRESRFTRTGCSCAGCPEPRRRVLRAWRHFCRPVDGVLRADLCQSRPNAWIDWRNRDRRANGRVSRETESGSKRAPATEKAPSWKSTPRDGSRPRSSPNRHQTTLSPPHALHGQRAGPQHATAPRRSKLNSQSNFRGAVHGLRGAVVGLTRPAGGILAGQPTL